MNPYQIEAAEKIESFRRSSGESGDEAAEFERAKARCMVNLQVQFYYIERLTLDQFTAAKKLRT